MERSQTKSIAVHFMVPLQFSVLLSFCTDAFGQAGASYPLTYPETFEMAARSQHSTSLNSETTSTRTQYQESAKRQGLTQDQKAENSEEQTSATDESGTIVVTGTHIRGAVAAGAKVDVYTSEDLDRSGYATVQDFIQTLPQNFQGGGVSEAPDNGALATSNQFGGAAVNLRGLGGDSTLTLINGRRTPQSGLEGNFTDISLIPQSAIERLEILSDGASALYGSDAIGGVVNIILKKDYNGAESRVRYGRTTTGGLDEYRLAQTLGAAWNGGTILINYEYYYRDWLTYGEKNFTSTSDHRPRGGTDLRSTSSSPGNLLDPLTFLPAIALPANQNGRALNTDQLIRGQVNLMDLARDATLLPRQEKNSLYAYLEQNLNENITIFAETLYNDREATTKYDFSQRTSLVPEQNPFHINPFGEGPVFVSYSLRPDIGLGNGKSRIKNFAATGGAKFNISEWRLQSYVSYGNQKSRQTSDVINGEELNRALADTNPLTALNVFGDGPVNNPQTIDKIRGKTIRRPRSRLYNVNSVADGPLVEIFGKTVSAAIGADYRREILRYSATINSNPIAPERYDRNIYAAFAELSASLVNPGDENPYIDALDISLAWRIDDYSDVGTTDNPKIGLKISPLKELELNATYGRSFRAPNLVERTQANNYTYISTVPDPRSPTGLTQALVAFGNDPNMQPESSKTWTVSAKIRPLQNNKLVLEVGYFSINYKDRIQSASPAEFLLPLEHLYPGVIVREPTQEDLNKFCSEPAFIDSMSECVPGLVKVIIDGRLRNMATSKVRGLDVLASYADEFIGMHFVLGVSATYLLEYSFQQTEASEFFDVVDTLNNPVDLRSRAYATLAGDSWSSTLTLNYTDSYKNDRSPVQNTIDSWFTVDLSATVNFNDRLSISRDAPFSLTFNAVNLFNNDPPFADYTIGYDTSNANPVGRILSVEFRAKW